MRTGRVLERMSATLVEIGERLAGMDARIVLELREQRPILEHIDDGVQSDAAGLMHVVDELRNGRGGPGTAPAA